MIGFRMRFIAWETNNVEDIDGLLQGLEMIIENRWTPIIIEGDSQVVNQMVMKLQNGSHIVKVSQSWRL